MTEYNTHTLVIAKPYDVNVNKITTAQYY